MTTGGRSSGSGATRPTPPAQGYTCEKALRLDHYQNGRHRLTSPAAPARRRRPSRRSTGTPPSPRSPPASTTCEAAHGGESILYYGGGGQGNHLGGAYGRATRAAFGSQYQSNALAQEKTGEFWVDGQLFGRPRCHTTGEWEEAEVLVFVGKNPWQSHGFPRARTVLKAVANDPDRTLIVIDPRRTETADLADHHLQVRPGGDAWALGALLAVLVDEDLLADRWLAEHATGLDELRAELARIPIADWCARAGLAEDDVRAVGPPDRHRQGRGVDLRGPRHPAGAALHAVLLPGEAPLPAHRQLRRARAA